MALATLGAAAGLALGLAILAGAPVVDGVSGDADARFDARLALPPPPSPEWSPVSVASVIAPATDATSSRGRGEARP